MQPSSSPKSAARWPRRFRGTNEEVRSLLALPGAARGGLQDLQQGVNGLIEGIVRTNLRASQELFRLANLGSYVELQHRFLREYLETFVENSATLVRAIRRTADETLGPLEQQIEQRRSAHQEHRQAAE
ncbi:MAG: phasin family protein [Acetobacteraceae bacterium]|nr:phasin family protein [Acetobacteraceae bacterium]